MTIYERQGAIGEWSINLLPSTPSTARNMVTPFSHVVVTQGRIPQARVSDAAILDGALYTGVVLGLPGRGFEIDGHGLAWWLGDAENNVGILESAVAGTAPLSTWVANLLPSSLTSGTVTSPGGNLTASYQWVTTRQALDSVVAHYGVEWRVRNDFTVDVATATNLYGAASVITSTGGSGNDVGVRGLDAEVVAERDYHEYASRVVVQGQGGRAAAGGASSFRDGRGNLFTRTRLADSQDTQAGSEGAVATNLLSLWSSTGGQREVKVTARRYAITSILPAGARLYVYDPTFHLYDQANQVMHRGRVTFPLNLRVVGVRWPVERGMGVYIRYYSGGSYLYYDLSDYVEYDEGPAELEVVG